MPVLKLMTNLEQIPENLETSLAQVLATSMNKPVEWMFVVIENNLRMARGNETKPMAFIEITSNNGLSEIANEMYTIDICDFLKTSLGLEPEQILINFRLIDSTMIGYNGHVLGSK